MTDEFERSLAEVLLDEGGYVNHPKDPGGATNKGVTQRVYTDYRARNGLPPKDVRYISDAEAAAIYRASYWDLGKCSQLPPGVSYVVFDGNVNSGVKQSVKWLQRAVGVRDDGLIGPTTIAAVKAYPNKAELVDRICDLRLSFLKALKTWPTFGKGWSRRVERVRKIGMSWANGRDISQSTQFVGLDPAPAKAYISDAQIAPSSAVGDALTGAGTAGTVLSQTIEQLTPLSQVEFVAKVITALTAVSVVIALGGIAYSMWARHRKAAIKDATQTGAA